MKKFSISLFLALFSFSYFAQIAITSEAFDNRLGVPQQVRQNYSIEKLSIDTKFKDQIADVSVTQEVKNITARDLEVEMFFPLPQTGIIQSFNMMVDGQEIPGKLLDKDEAKRIYEGIVNRKKDPALMEYIGNGLFKTSVFPIKVGETRKITITYTQVCSRNMDQITFSYPLATQKFSTNPVRNVSFSARIQTTEPVKSIYSPLENVQVDRISDKESYVKYESNNSIPQSDFRLTYTLQNGPVGASVLSYKPEANEDGYFMVLASPSIELEDQQPMPKNIVFVLDRSGSMSGKKIEQSKKALKFVLGNLNEGDRFNIYDYDDRVDGFKSQLEPYTSTSLSSATNYVDNIRSGGGTNINDALVKALTSLDDERPNYVIFLTDGLPTSGVVDEMQIATNVQNANKHNARIFAFGVGNDVNARLLERLATNNGGMTAYVKPTEDIETAVSQLYSNISSPVMTDISIRFSDTDVRSTYPEKLPDLFKGGQLVWVGKYSKPGKNVVTLTGTINGKIRSFRFDADLVNDKDVQEHDYLAKIWASRRIGYLIDQIDQHGKNQELVDELVNLSKEYGILTPYTAFLAREDVDLADNTNLIRSSNEELKMLDQVSGASANNLRKQKNSFSSNAAAPTSMDISFKNAEGETEKVETVKNVGNKVFYLRNGQWVEGTLTKEEIKNATVVKQFTDDYFELANDKSNNSYLAFESNIVVKLNNKVYNIIK